MLDMIKEKCGWELIVKYSGNTRSGQANGAIGYGTVERLCGYCSSRKNGSDNWLQLGSGIYRKTEKAVFSN